MTRTVRSSLAAAVLLALAACSKPAPPPPQPPPARPAPAAAGTEGSAGMDAAREREFQEAAIGAYIYGYPLVSMELTRRVSTNVAKPVPGKQAPMGQVARLRAYPTPADRVVTTPNADTLYTVAWLDVSAAPWIISVPDMKGRYFMLPLLSGWTDVFASPGTRTTGGKAQKFAVTGPGWMGKLPAGVKELKSPTAMVWMLGRIYSSGTKADLAEVHALQDKITVTPLSAWGKKYVPPAGKPDPAVDMKSPPRDQVNALDAVAYFKLLASLLKTNPPASADTGAVASLGKLGLVPGQDFDGSKLDAGALKALASAPKQAQAKLLGQGNRSGTSVNGWAIGVSGMGVYGTDYLQRAYITAIGLGANLPQDAVYPFGELDAEGKALDGSKKYVVHFPKGHLPPARAFWSLTMYDDQMFFAPNPLNRYNRSSRDKLKANKDGSIDLLVQKESPGKAREANWLPAPAGKFNLVMRVYWPQEKPPSILDGTWKPPAITPAK